MDEDELVIIEDEPLEVEEPLQEAEPETAPLEQQISIEALREAAEAKVIAENADNTAVGTVNLLEEATNQWKKIQEDLGSTVSAMVETMNQLSSDLASIQSRLSVLEAKSQSENTEEPMKEPPKNELTTKEEAESPTSSNETSTETSEETVTEVQENAVEDEKDGSETARHNRVILY